MLRTAVKWVSDPNNPKLSSALRGMPVAVRAMPAQDGCYGVYFMHHKLREIDLRED